MIVRFYSSFAQFFHLAGQEEIDRQCAWINATTPASTCVVFFHFFAKLFRPNIYASQPAKAPAKRAKVAQAGLLTTRTSRCWLLQERPFCWPGSFFSCWTTKSNLCLLVAVVVRWTVFRSALGLVDRYIHWILCESQELNQWKLTSPPKKKYGHVE